MGLLNIDPFGENKIEEKKTESTIDPVTDIIGENKTDNFNMISIDELLDMKLSEISDFFLGELMESGKKCIKADLPRH